MGVNVLYFYLVNLLNIYAVLCFNSYQTKFSLQVYVSAHYLVII